ncbi:hypothetical protein DM01DRAFT_1332588 [Hesseltinella vesiculosa]|uniref:Uncharacterized protein n=1 Tax=Hesseltinella vesiculosa TaxID=101127 RepID=A0A1X2GSH8_9FUNG|nr:hypothetical protein DM01DRAFT_1332588 [Hesseltinella vesiculosa]
MLLNVRFGWIMAALLSVAVLADPEEPLVGDLEVSLVVDAPVLPLVSSEPEPVATVADVEIAKEGDDVMMTLQLLKMLNNSDVSPQRILKEGRFTTVSMGRKQDLLRKDPAGLPIIADCYKAPIPAVSLTMYWIPKENEWDVNDEGRRILLDRGPGTTLVDLLNPTGQHIASVSQAMYQKCRMEGTCLLSSGDLINLSSDQADSFYVIGKKGRRHNIFGWGTGEQNLVPYVSVASNDLPLGTTMYVPELDGINLGNGFHHNGCLRVDDDGWSFKGCQLDLFVVSYVDHLWLDLELGGLDRVTTHLRPCTVLNYATEDQLRYVQADHRPETLPMVMHDRMSMYVSDKAPKDGKASVNVEDII